MSTFIKYDSENIHSIEEFDSKLRNAFNIEKEIIKQIRSKTDTNLINSYKVRKVIRILNSNLKREEKIKKLNKIKVTEEEEDEIHSNDENYLIDLVQKFNLDIINTINHPLLMTNSTLFNNTEPQKANITIKTTVVKSIPLNKDVMQGNTNMEFAAKLKLGMNPFEGLTLNNNKNKTVTMIKQEVVNNNKKSNDNKSNRKSDSKDSDEESEDLDKELEDNFLT